MSPIFPDHDIEAREVPLGGLRAMQVHRTLPSRHLPTIGTWCFVDHFGPTTQDMTVLPHPHIGLQTVTWPVQGRIRHRDSLGNDVVLEPGELNLMTSGNGISHSEFSVEGGDPLAGVQLWTVMPDDSRTGAATFEHLPDLPVIEREGFKATVLMGTFLGETSRATTYAPIVGVELRLEPGTHEIELDPSFEYGVLAVDGGVDVAGEQVAHRVLRYVAPGRERLELSVDESRIVMLIGGEPFDEDIIMWWNFIGRTHDEIVQARDEWNSLEDRFGHVAGHADQSGVYQWIPAPPMPEVVLKPRRRRGQGM